MVRHAPDLPDSEIGRLEFSLETSASLVDSGNWYPSFPWTVVLHLIMCVSKGQKWGPSQIYLLALSLMHHWCIWKIYFWLCVCGGTHKHGRLWRRVALDPLKLELWAILCGCWKLNSGPLEEPFHHLCSPVWISPLWKLVLHWCLVRSLTRQIRSLLRQGTADVPHRSLYTTDGRILLIHSSTQVTALVSTSLTGQVLSLGTTLEPPWLQFLVAPFPNQSCV